MPGASHFLTMLSMAVFLACAWTATRVSKLAGVSSIVLEVTTGLILGPSLLKLVVPEYAQCEASRHIDCTPPHNFAQLIAEGKPLGEGLGMVANMPGVCSRPAYSHHRLGRQRTSGGGDPDAADGNATDDAADGDDAGEDAGEEEVVEWAWGDNTNASDVEDEEGGEAEIGDRRLSGSGSYRSYEECLVKSCEAEIVSHCQSMPSFFTLLGHAGVSLMIFESGMHFDFEKVRQAGPKPYCVAGLGILLPLVTGALLAVMYGRPLVPDGVSVGTALAPSSIGIALQILGEAKVLQEDFAQAITVAAFVGDVLSLVLVEVLFSSLRGNSDALSIVVFPLISVACMAIAVFLALKFWPRFINEVVLPKVPAREGANVSTKDDALFLMMVMVLVTYATAAQFLGSHLWGCFVAGMSFACLDKDQRAHHVWVKRTKRATSWMIRIFFAGTVAFSIPVGTLISFDVFLKGLLMGIGPCVVAKVVCAPFMGPARFVVGWAMVGRAELAYLIAQMAAAAGMMDGTTFSILIWALLSADIFSPFIFRKNLTRYMQQHRPDVVGQPPLGAVEGGSGGSCPKGVDLLADQA